MQYNENKIELEKGGYSITSVLYSKKERSEICDLIDKNTSFSKEQPVYSIRKLLNAIPSLSQVLFNPNLIELIHEVGGKNYFLTKAIYFDKPQGSNWFVSYHQDLSISVLERHNTDGYKNWTVKKAQFGVQPPDEILNKTITVRIHLDDADATNGALKVIPESQRKGSVRFQKEWIDSEGEVICNVNAGASMLMKPLTFHASKKSSNGKRRRVIHLEFCDQELQKPLIWSERLSIIERNQ